MSKFKLIATASLILAVTATAGAVTFRRPLVVGERIFFKINNFDSGTLYPLAPVVGTSWGGTGNNLADVNTLDAIPLQTPGIGSLQVPAGPSLPAPPVPSLEDTWGIVKVTEIQDTFSNTLWLPGDTNTELTGIFYGLADIYLEQATATVQRAEGVNFHFELYEAAIAGSQPPDFDASQGTGGRTGLTGYTTATDGVLALSAISVPGHINGPGVRSGANAEFQSTNDIAAIMAGASATVGSGVTFMDITGGTLQPVFDPEFWGAPDSADAFQPLPLNVGVAGSQGADIRLDFTNKVPGPVGTDWLLRSNDPGEMVVAIPEPMTMLGVFMGVGGLAGYIRRRR